MNFFLFSRGAWPFAAICCFRNILGLLIAGTIVLALVPLLSHVPKKQATLAIDNSNGKINIYFNSKKIFPFVF